MLTQGVFRRTGNKSAAAGNVLARFCPTLLAGYTPGQPTRDLGATFTRTTTATYPDASSVTQTAAINTIRDSAFFGGSRTVEMEGASTNHFLNSGAPVTQTSPSLATGSYTLWITGTGSVAVAGTTATITGAGTAVAGTPVTFVVTVAGTVTYTVTGSPTTVQAENLGFSSSYIPTVGATVTRGADSYSVPFTTPPQAMTLYTKFKEMGTIGVASARVLEIGTNAPRVILQAVGGKYNWFHDNGTTTASVTAVAAPAIGDIVELRAVIGADGMVTIGQTINGGAEAVVAGTTAALAAAWGDQVLYLGNRTGGNNAFAAFLVPYKVALGVQTLATMRAR